MVPAKKLTDVVGSLVVARRHVRQQAGRTKGRSHVRETRSQLPGPGLLAVLARVRGASASLRLLACAIVCRRMPAGESGRERVRRERAHHTAERVPIVRIPHMPIIRHLSRAVPEGWGGEMKDGLRVRGISSGDA